MSASATQGGHNNNASLRGGRRRVQTAAVDRRRNVRQARSR